MNAKESIVFMFKGVSNWAPYWQFHFGDGGGGFELGTLLAVSFWGGRGSFKLGTILAVSFWGGRGGTSAGRLVNFDSFSEIGYRTPNDIGRPKSH